MRIKDGLGLEKDIYNRVQIPDCNRLDLPKFLKDEGFEKGVEIGVSRGKFIKSFCEASLEITGVDPWRSDDIYPYEGYGNFKTGQEELDSFYAETKRVTKDFANCRLLRKTSMEALEDFEDNSLDFVYIDGHHGFKFVTEDIYEWSKKVKKGGIIAGHDYVYTKAGPHDAMVIHAKYVVDAYTRAFSIDKWYILGSAKKIQGEKRDPFRSWMWLNEK